MTEIKKNSLIELMHYIEQSIDHLIKKNAELQLEINRLNDQNNYLKDLNKQTLEQIEKYIAELEQIRKHYADSNN